MSDITAATIDRILELAPANTLEIDGFTYIDKDKTVILFKPPVLTAIGISTLTGIVNLLENKFEGLISAGTMIHVVSQDLVTVFHRHSDNFGRRQEYINAKRLKPEKEFAFNAYLPQEKFVIALRSQFVPSSELDALVALAGNIAKETEVRQEDDGFGQRVTMKGGVHLVAERTLNPRVTLKPFRTFLEADQPESVFLFRVQHDEMQGNLCALFEADGGGWKLQAMENVKTWLTNQLKGSEVAGLPDIPVIS